mgnify:CR=1 FL=1
MGSEFKLGHRCTVKSSKRIFAREYVEHGIPFWRSKDVIDKALGVFSSYDLYISEERFEEIDSKFGSPQKGDLLLSSVGNRAGQPYVIEEEENFYFKDGNILWLSEFNGINPRFLAYWLKSDFGQNKLSSVMIGSAQKALTIDAIRNLNVKFPPEYYQVNAVKILLAIDNKIELNQKTNQTLEQMAQALFKSWFVDFDPVFDNLLASVDFNLENLENRLPDELKQKAQRRLAALDSLHNAAEIKTSLSALAHELQAQLPTKEATKAAVQAAETPVEPNFSTNPNILPQQANTHAHFPNEFEHNEQLGWIPKGWGVGVSGDLVDVRDGTHDSPKKSEKGFPLVTSRHITSGRLDLSAAYLISELDYKKVNERSNVEYGDILLTMIGTVGVPYLVMDEPANYAIKNVGLFRTSQNLYLKNYLHILLKTAHMQAYLNARVAGTTQKYLSLKVLRNIDFLLPSNIVLEKFNSIVNNMLFKEKSNIDQINQLTKLRDTLLPKLISGELQIPDVTID